ncbi:MAG: 6-carboxytetrahydropterin synthase [Alphaproteobacteria bacterium]
MYELGKQFRFDSAHTLEREMSEQQNESSRTIHGHSYRAEVILRAAVLPKSGMVVDLAVLENALAEMHRALDHRMLNDIPGLEIPTMENICHWIWEKLAGDFPGLARVAVYRDSSGESCIYNGALNKS